MPDTEKALRACTSCLPPEGRLGVRVFIAHGLVPGTRPIFATCGQLLCLNIDLSLTGVCIALNRSKDMVGTGWTENERVCMRRWMNNYDRHLQHDLAFSWNVQ